MGDDENVSPGRATVFISYSREERNWCERIRKHLQPLVDEGLIELWADDRMEPGDTIDDEIARALERSKMAMLLMSASFMRTGSYALEREVPRILAAEREGRMRVFTVHVTRSGFLDHAELKALLSVNEPERPLAAASEDECQAALAKLARDIRTHLRAAAAALPSVDWRDDLLRGVTGGTAENIRAFLREYVGTHDEPVAFGGRAATMEMLQQWIDDAAGRSHCFLVAPTGLGKSAVVCRFVEALAAGTDIVAVFLPVSLRFGTNRAGAVRGALVDRLAFLHGERAPGDLDLDASWTMLAQYLRRPLPEGRRLLLVLDGLDEAADWELPAGRLSELAPDTKVLISLRGAPETDAPRLRERLALPAKRVRVETLAALDHAGVAEALRAIGRPDLAADAARLERLFTLSEGDPLVLHLLLAELSERGDDAIFAATPDLRTGLRGVWERQLSTTDRDALGERGATAALFAILTCALGPVERDDLLSLAPEVLPHGATLDAVQQRWHRFVLRSDAGYSFFYPRLREFYADEMLPPAERDRWRRQLLDYGRAAVARLAADDTASVSPFVLRFHGAHLERYGGTLDNLAMLVSPRWRNAWMQHPAGQAGFLRDVERAWSSAMLAPSLAIAVRCALTRATIRSEARNLRPELLQALVARSVWSPAQALAHLQAAVEIGSDQDDESLATSLAVIRPFLTDRLLVEGLNVATSLANKDRSNGFEPWLAFVEPLAAVAPDELERAAYRLRHDWQRCAGLIAVAKALPDRCWHRRDSIMRDARRLIDEAPRPHAFLNRLLFLGDGLADLPDSAELLEIARTEIDKLEEGAPRASYLKRMAPHVDDASRAIVVLKAFHEACRGAHPSLHGMFKLLPLVSDDEARSAVALVFAVDGLDLLVETLRHDQRPISVWTAWSPWLDDAQREVVAHAWINSAFRDSPSRLREPAAAGFADQVLKVVREEPDPHRRDQALADLARHLDIDEQLALVGRLCAYADTTVWQLEELIDTLATTRPAAAAATICLGSQPLLIARGLLIIAARSDVAARAPYIALARAATRRVEGGLDRLSLLAEALALDPTDSACGELVNELAELPSSRARATRHHLDRVIRRLPDRQAGVLRRQLSTHDDDEIDLFLGDAETRLRTAGRRGIARMTPGWPRVQAGIWLSELLDGDEGKAAAIDALQAARDVGDASSISGALGRLAPRVALQQRVFERAKAEARPGERFVALANLHVEDQALRDEVHRATVEAARASLDDPSVLARSYYLRHAPSDERSMIVARLLEDARRGIRTGRDSFGFGDAPEIHARQLLGEVIRHLTWDQAEEALAWLPWEWTGHALALLRLFGSRDGSQQKLDEALPEVLRLARGRDDIARAQALAAAVGYVSPEDRGPLIDEVLGEVLFVNYGDSSRDARASVLPHLASHLREHHLDRAIDIALEAWKSKLGIGQFVTLLPLAQRPAVIGRLFNDAIALGDHHALIAGLLPHLPDTALDSVIDALERCNDRSMMTVIIGQTARFSVPQLERLFLLAHTASRRGRSQPQDTTIDVLGALGAELLARSHEHAPRMLELVIELLRDRATNRPELLYAIAGLAPLLRALVGQDGVDAIATEILDVTGWWP